MSWIIITFLARGEPSPQAVGYYRPLAIVIIRANVTDNSFSEYQCRPGLFYPSYFYLVFCWPPISLSRFLVIVCTSLHASTVIFAEEVIRNRVWISPQVPCPWNQFFQRRNRREFRNYILQFQVNNNKKLPKRHNFMESHYNLIICIFFKY